MESYSGSSFNQVKELAEQGYIKMSIPTKWGGLGLDLFEWGQKLKLLGYENSDLALPLLISLRSSVTLSLAMEDRPSWTERYVKPMLTGLCQGSFAYTERSDIFNLKTSLKKNGSKFLLSGEKLFITGGQDADVFLVYAKDLDDNDVKVALVEKDWPGVTVIPAFGHGLLGARFAKLILDNVEVDPDQLFQNIDGISHAQYFLNSRRVLLVSGLVGRMQAVLEACISYGLNTIRYGRPLAKLPNFQAGLGRLFGLQRTSEKLLSAGLTELKANSHDTYWDADLSAIKWAITERAQEFALEALRLTGGEGFEFSHPVACFHRDAAGLISGGGTQDVLQMDMGVFATHIFERRSK